MNMKSKETIQDYFSRVSILVIISELELKCCLRIFARSKIFSPYKNM